MAEIDDVMDKLDDVMEKLGEIETKVNLDSNYYRNCPHCGGDSGDTASCPGCNEEGLVLLGKIQKAEG